jgi:hypothetical protein
MAIPCTFTVLDDCSDLSSWTVTTGAGCAAVETTDFVRNGAKAFRLTTPAAGGSPQINLTKNIAHSFKQDDRIGALCYSPSKPVGGTSGLNLFGSDQTNLGTGGVGRWSRVLGTSGGPGEEVQGWQLFPVRFQDTAVASGTPTIALNYLSLRAQITATASYARDLVLDSIVKWNQRPTVIIQFDDGWLSSYVEGFGYANPRDIPLTHFLIPSLMDQGSYMSTAQALEMRAAGDTLGAHGLATNGWELAPQSIKADADALRQKLGVPIAHGAYPNGGYGQVTGNYAAVQESMNVAGLISGRTVTKAMALSGAFSPYTLPATLNLQTGTTLNDAKAEIDRCIKLRMTCIIIAHKLEATAGASQWAISDWKGLVDYIVERRKSGQLDALSMDQWWGQTRARAAR